jgi:hypothetical protein
MSFKLITDAAKAIWQRQPLATANLTGNAFLLLILYSWSTAYDRPTAEEAMSIVILLGVCFFGLWLHATTLATFQLDGKDTPFGPALRRLHHFLPWALAALGTLWLTSWLGRTVSFATGVSTFWHSPDLNGGAFLRGDSLAISTSVGLFIVDRPT